MGTIKNIVSAYKKYAKYPSLISAKFITNSSPYLINSTWSTTDLISSKEKSVGTNYLYDENKQVYKFIPVLIDEEIMNDVYSTSYDYRAICLERKNSEVQGKDNKTNIIYIWANDLVVKTINITELDVHGSVYKVSFNFGSFDWLVDGEKLIYVAEAKKIKKVSYFQNTSNDNSAKQPVIGTQYLYTRNFGEQLGSVHEPVICILDIDTEKIEVLDSNALCSGSTIGRVCTHPSGSGFAFTAYKGMPFDLGLIYCTQRISDLFYYDCSLKSITKIGAENKSKYSPKFSPDGTFLVWLEHDSNGPHMQCQKLMKYDILSDVTTTVVDIVRNSDTEFTGIYNLGLIKNCWSPDGKYIFIDSQVRCQHKILQIHLETGDVQVLHGNNFISSESLLDINDKFLLVKVSDPSTVPYIAIADMESLFKEKRLNMVPISSVHKFDNILEVQVIDHEPVFTHPKYGKAKYQSIYISSKKEGPRPLILSLHGGPHSAINSDYRIFTNLLADFGYNMLLINYRGSWGYGQDFIESLLGHIGEMDVSDCIKACEDVLLKFPSKIDSDNIFLCGGSHGGFLGAHLAAKYNTKVRATAIINPVINLPSMLGSTDIPDWTYTESGYLWDYNNLITNEQLITMWNKSPLKFIDDVKSPILLLIGQEDKRVPPSQGFELHKALLARSIPTELHLYPKDSHPLSSPESSNDCLINMVLWFNKHLTH